MSTTLTARDTTLPELVQMLTDQQARKVDMVVPASHLAAQDGNMRITGADHQITLEGVTVTDGVYGPTPVALEGISSKLGIPVKYLKTMHNDRPDLFDANVNGWLHGPDGDDPRSFLIRAFRMDDDDPARIGVMRAMLSDSYRFIDHFDTLTACLDGIRSAGIDVEFAGCNLSERRMSVRVAAPEVAALAPSLLAGYRSPFDNGGAERAVQLRDHGWLERGNEETVFAGFDLTNSETGGGAFTITPVLIVKVCRNGLKITGDALRSVHLGSRLDDGLIRWSDETQQRTLELVQSQTRDAVSTFLDADYVNRTVTRLAEKAGHRINNPQTTVETVTRQLGIPAEYRETVLAHFITGGQITAGGVMQAVTSAAQTIADPDVAAEVEATAVDALDAVARLANA